MGPTGVANFTPNLTPNLLTTSTSDSNENSYDDKSEVVVEKNMIPVVMILMVIFSTTTIR